MQRCGKCRRLSLLIFTALVCLLDPAFSTPKSGTAKPITVQIAHTPVARAESQSAPTADVVPQDAEELLLAAAQVNGLDAPRLKPWHILVSYDKFDEDGDNVDSGTYEEFWAGAKQYRLIFTSHDFTQTEIATDAGLFRTGDDKWPGVLQTRARDEFVRPMFREMKLQFARAEKRYESSASYNFLASCSVAAT